MINAQMKQLLLNGNCLKEGVARGDVIVLIIKKQSKKNDILMKQQSGILYGNTKFTDEQILYFFRKHNGNVSAITRELRCCYETVKGRLTRLGLKAKGRGYGGNLGSKKYSDKDVADAIKKAGGNKKKAAKILGCSIATIHNRT